MSDAEERILRRQGRKLAKAWFDAEPSRISSIEECLDSLDHEGIKLAFEQMGKSVFLTRLAKQPSRWETELREILALPPTTDAFLEARKSELHYRALQVGPNLFRSCQPYLKHLDALKRERQLTRVINLREESEASRQYCDELGLDYVHLSVTDHSVPKVEQVQEFFRLLDTGMNLVHCLAGRGRTGVFVACYRIKRGQKPQEALAQTEAEVRPLRTHQQEWVIAFGKNADL